MSEFERYFKRPNPDLAYVYELFLRRAFHCGRNEDPFSIVDADSFSFKENGRLETETLVGIWTGMSLLIDQVTVKDDKYRIHKLRESIEDTPTKRNFQNMCEELFKILEENKIEEFPHWKALPFNN